MFERLNQPISLRRKPTDTDRDDAAGAAQQSAAADGDGERGGRRSLLSRLNQPISIRRRSKPANGAPEQQASLLDAVLAARAAERPGGAGDPVVAAASEHGAPMSEPVVEAASEEPASVSEPVVEAASEEPASLGERVAASAEPPAAGEPTVGEPTVELAAERHAARSGGAAPYLRPAAPPSEPDEAAPHAAPAEPRLEAPPAGGVPLEESAPPYSASRVAPVDPAQPDPSLAPVATDPAPPVEAPRTRGSKLGRLGQPISLGRTRTASKAPAAASGTPVAAAPPGAATASAAKARGSRLGRLGQPISLGRRSGGGSAPSERPVAPRRRIAHAPQRPRRTRNLVGLEIEPGQLVAARSHLNGELVVERAVGTPIAPNIVRDGEVTDIDALSAALSDLFDGSGLDRRVRIGIANQRIVMRQLELPPILDPKELANAVRFQAQDEIPMPIESVVLDHHALGIVQTDNGARMRVLLVAARRDMVERVLLAARQAGLRPEGVDLAAFGMIRALRPLDLAETDQVLYLAVGGLTNLAIARGSTCEFTRAITTGIDTIVGEVAGRIGLPYPDARRLVSSISATLVGPRPLSDAGTSGLALPGLSESPDGPTAEHAEFARIALGDGIRRIAAEVRNSLDFHLGTHGESPIVRTVLTGPALDLAGFDQALGRELGMPLTRGEVGLASATAAGHVPMSRLAVAAGLSVAEGPR